MVELTGVGPFGKVLGPNDFSSNHDQLPLPKAISSLEQVLHQAAPSSLSLRVASSTVSQLERNMVNSKHYSMLSPLMRVCLVAACGSFLFGYNVAVLNTCISHLAWEWNWCPESGANEFGGVAKCRSAQIKVSFLSTAVFLGAAAGSLSTGSLLKGGKRHVLLMAMIMFTIGILASTVAGGFSSLLFARLLVGWAVGVASVASPGYMSEVAKKEIRGSYGITHQVFVTVGVFMGLAVGLPLSALPQPGAAAGDIDRFSSIWWRIMLLASIVPVLICGVFLLWIYPLETPHYLMQHNKTKEAEEYLRYLYPEDDDSSVTMAEISGDSNRAQPVRLRTAIIIPIFRTCLFHTFSLALFQQFSGINALVANSNYLLLQAGLSSAAVTGASVAMSLINVVMNIPPIFLIESLGRKTLLLIGSSFQTLSLLPAAIVFCRPPGDLPSYAGWIAVGSVYGYMVAFSFAYGPVLWVYLAEVFPEEIRGVGAGFATAAHWIAAILVVMINPFIPMTIIFGVFSAMSALSVLIIWLMCSETRGNTLGDSPYKFDPEPLTSKQKSQIEIHTLDS